MIIRRVFLIAAAIWCQTLLLQAQNRVVTVDGADFKFAVPKDFCVLNDNNERDASFISIVSSLLQGSGNRLILTTADCESLQAWRKGAPNLFRYAFYYIQEADSSPLPGDDASLRNALCQEMRKQNNASLSGVKDVVAKVAKEMQTHLTVNSTKVIGVLGEDIHGCYTAILIGVKGSHGKNILMSGIVTTTVIHGKPLFFAMYNQYRGAGTTTEDIERSKAVAAEFDQANP